VTLMFARRGLIQAAWFAGLVVVVGCAKPNTNLATVSGVVTQNGAPVNGAKVTLYSTAQAEGQGGGIYSALTDSSGKYLIATVGKENGIPPGMYKVTIVKLDAAGANLPKDFDAGQMEASGAAKNVLPKDYENQNTTKLSVTLDVGKNEGKNFDLTGAASGSTPSKTP